jgi:hypothetical protein
MCDKELCHPCSHAAPIGDYYFCDDCFRDEFQKIYTNFVLVWESLIKRHNSESTELIDKYKYELDNSIKRNKAKRKA